MAKLFYSSYAAAGFTFLTYAAIVATKATRSISEALTASLLLSLDLAAFLVWNSNVNYVSDVMGRGVLLGDGERRTGRHVGSQLEGQPEIPHPATAGTARIQRPEQRRLHVP